MEHLSQEDAKWLIEDYNKIRGYGRVNDWIDYHIKAMSLIRDTVYNKPSCNCEFASYARMANSFFEQHYEEIKNRAEHK
jgi:hypothetical protein